MNDCFGMKTMEEFEDILNTEMILAHILHDLLTEWCILFDNLHDISLHHHYRNIT